MWSAAAGGLSAPEPPSVASVRLLLGMVRLRRRLMPLLAAALPLLPLLPARAIDEVVMELPLLQTSLTVKLSELQDPEALRNGSSELAELDRASDGALARKLLQLFHQPMPLGLSQIAAGSVGSPLLEQALLLVSSFGHVEGQRTDLSGETLRLALQKAAAEAPNGEPSLLQVMEAIPGERVRLNLSQVERIAARLLRQRSQADQLLAASSVAATPPVGPAPAAVQVSRSRLQVSHRQEPLELLVVQPRDAANGRLVLISHGLWDSPLNFQGWAERLAAQGYTVVLPWHPGSDQQQQHEVLTGQAPPPSPDELGWRGRDLIAVIDAIGQRQIPALPALDTSRVVAIGHSWGATTTLQLAGVRPSAENLSQRCNDLNHPDRNLSWTLQCSWLTGVGQAALQDPRVIAVAAVSPPLSLLFPRGSGRDMSARVLLVSGSRDWVVPPDPEAIEPMRAGQTLGNQLVLVKGGDHFNLRPGQGPSGGVLGPLLLQWTEAAFAAGPAVRPQPGAAPLLPNGAWGSSVRPLADVTQQLKGS